MTICNFDLKLSVFCLLIMKNNFRFIDNNIFCINCGNCGHYYKNCLQPTISLGIIMVKIDFNNNKIIDEFIKNTNNLNYNINTTVGINYHSSNDIESFCLFKDKIKFLLIRRKHTLGYIEFIRGRYSIENVDGIIFLFKQMTRREIHLIGSKDFDYLWNDLWSKNCDYIEDNDPYKNEKIKSRIKFNNLKYKHNDNYLNLEYYVKNVKPKWKFPEWGFPKGRRNFGESDISCAKREFQEESGFNNNDYVILNKIKRLDENFIGTNGKNYKHIYYLAVNICNKEPTIDINNTLQSNEIGDIGWFNFADAIKLIRPHHTERKKILTESYMYIINNLSDTYKNLK